MPCPLWVENGHNGVHNQYKVAMTAIAGAATNAVDTKERFLASVNDLPESRSELRRQIAPMSKAVRDACLWLSMTERGTVGAGSPSWDMTP